MGTDIRAHIDAISKDNRLNSQNTACPPNTIVEGALKTPYGANALRRKKAHPRDQMPGRSSTYPPKTNTERS